MKATRPINILFVLKDRNLESQIRRSMLSAAHSPEWHASFVNSGNAAISSLKNNIPIDIVFTELSLPVMNGLSLLRHLQTEHPNIKSVLLSHKDDYKTIRAALNRGAFDFLLLPLDLPDFEQTLNKVLDETKILRISASNQAELQALEHEFDIARKIQTTVISNRDPELNNDDRFEIGGHSQPAHRVGGDFYDYFFLDKNHLGFVIGDVASKGLPAALFMATSRTLIRSLAFQGYPPDLCLQEVNKILFRESDASLFIAVFYGILDLSTGEIIYSNAGHTFPYHVTSEENTRILDDPGGMVLGVLEESGYILQRLNMMTGDILFLYTDGFLAMTNNDDNNLFESCIKKHLIKSNSQRLSKVILTLFNDMYHLTNNSQTEDDLTSFAIKFRGKNGINYQ